MRLPHRRAAVAVVERDGDVLFIRRPERPGDPWSGHVAFPGGHALPEESFVDAAARETHEEVGLRLDATTGHLRDRWGGRPGRWLRVRPVLFSHRGDATLTLDPREVAEAFWVPRARLARLPVVPGLRRVAGLPVPVPTVDLDGRVLWGLTLSMVRELVAR